MSLTSVRAALADALSDVEGITGHVHPPAAITAGDAWPVWVQTRPLSFCAADTDFDVYVAVAATADLAATIDAGDALMDAVVSALLWAGCEVQTVEPAAAVAQDAATQIPCLRIRCVVGVDLSSA